jgi:YbbR domain-containing protein
MDKFLENNTVVKGIAFVLAFMLWMIVSLDDQPQSPVRQQEGELTIDNVKVEAVYDEELYSIMEMEDTVQVLVSGRRALLNLNMLKADPYRVYVDLTGLGAGEHRVPLKYEGFPAELRVEIMPRFVRVVLEEKELKPFPVLIETTGNQKEGFKLGVPVIDPKEVHVIAPSSILEQVAFVKGFVNVDKAGETITQNVNLKVYDQQGNEIPAEVSPDVVGVEVPVTSPSVRVPLKINWINELPEGISFAGVDAKLKEVEVFAPLNVLEGVTEVQATVDLAKIERTQTLPYDIPLEKGWLRVEPDQAQIEVRVGATLERTYSKIPITVVGLREEFELEFIDPENGELTMDVLGSRERLDQVGANDIQASIDVSELSSGRHLVPLNYILPAHLEASQANINVRVNIRQVDEAQETITDVSEEENGGE